MIESMSFMDPSNRQTFWGKWGLLCQFVCVPVDLTDAERVTLLEQVRDSLGDDFVSMPLAFIEDRLYGGLVCPDAPHRRHVAFMTGQYGYLAAQEGRYWANPASKRAEGWAELRKYNPDDEWADPPGPFTDDKPE